MDLQQAINMVTNKEKLDLIEGIMKLMTLHKVTEVSIDNIKINKSIHIQEEQTSKQPVLTDEDVLFYSSRGN